MSETSKPRGTYNSAAKREAILETARRRFTAHSYEQVTVRDIASEAGVNVALVIRYFGSKEALFERAVAQEFDLTPLLEGDREALGKQLAQYVLQKDASRGDVDPLLAMLRSVPSEPAGTLLRRSLDEQFIHPLADWLGGEQALLRAGLIAAELMGLMVMRDVIKSEVFVKGDEGELMALTGSTLQRYINGHLARTP